MDTNIQLRADAMLQGQGYIPPTNITRIVRREGGSVHRLIVNDYDQDRDEFICQIEFSFVNDDTSLMPQSEVDDGRINAMMLALLVGEWGEPDEFLNRTFDVVM